MRILANLNVVGTLDIDTVANAGADTDRFLVQDANGVVKYRTGAEVASDIGAAVGYVSTVKHEVKLGEAISKGQAVYVSGSDGTNMIVSKASNASEATSSKTFGLLESGGAQNAKVFVITEGLLAGLDTSTATIGDPVWLGTAGNLIYGLGSKPYAPAHLVFIGIVTRVNANNGEIFVKVQNGFELQELHNVQITTTPANNTVLSYETATSLYKMKSIPTLLGYTPADDSAVVHIAGTETITGTKTFSATTTTFAKAVFNAPTGGATGEGIVVGKSIKLDASGVGESAKIYVVSKDLSDTYGSGLQIQFANADDNKGFGFNLNTSGGYEIYTKNAGAAWVKALTISNTQAATFAGNISAANLSGTNTGDQTLSGLGGVPTTRTLTINGTSYDLSADRSWTITAGVSGSGTANQVAYWNGSSSVTGNAFLTVNLSSVDPNAPLGELILTGGPSYKNATLLINRYTNAWESGIRLQTNGATDWYIGQSASGSNNNIEFYSYGSSSVALTLIKASANANFGASVGIGSTSLTGYSLRVAKNITGDITGIGIGSNGTVQSDVTSSASAFNTEINTAAASFTLDSLIHYRAAQGTKGAGSTITNQYGFIAHGSMTGATNNYGFFGSIDSGANRWNLYMSGTAANYINGDTSIGTLTGGYKLNVGGTMNVTGAMTGSTTATFLGKVTGKGLRSSAVKTGYVAQNQSGWFRVARLFVSPQTSQPHGGIITISFGSPTIANPVTYVTKYFWSTTGVATLKLEKYGTEDYITDARIINPTSSSAYFLEFYFNSTSAVAGHVFGIFHDELLGNYADLIEIYETLPTGTASGTTVASLPFLDHGTTVHSLNVVSFGSFGSSVTANSFVKSGGLTSQFLKANGDVDGTTYQPVLTNPVTGTGTINQIAYWTSSSEIGALSTTTYPSLTELSYVKGVTSAIQTQLNAKEPTLTKGNLTSADTAFLSITGGTGAVIGSGANITVVPSGIVSSGLILTTTGSSGAATKTTNTLNIPNYTFDGLSPMTTLGDTIYEGSGGVALRLAGNTTTTKQFLSQTGTGTVSAAPVWSAVTKSDVGLSNVENTALSTWAGSTNITTLGTITSGTWSASTIAVARGGTGLTALGTANQLLRVNSGATALEYFTPAYLTAEADTLASVTARGATTSTKVDFVEVGSKKAGSDTAGSGPYFRWTNADETRQWMTQLNAANGLTTYRYNGSSWANILTMAQNGATTLNGNMTVWGGNPAKFILQDTNPELYVHAANGTARLFINRQMTGTQAQLWWTTAAPTTLTTTWDGTGAEWSMGLTSSSNVNNLKIARGDIFDAGSVALEFATNKDATFYGKIIKSGGTTSQFLKANGDVDSTSYLSGASTFNLGTTSITLNRASGNQLLTGIELSGIDNTYGNALLQSGAGRPDTAVGDTWIFADSLGSDANKWGIKHNQPDNRIEFWGNNAIGSYVQLNTGFYSGTAASVTNGVYTNSNNSLTAGNRIVIQNSQDGGNTRGIFMWNSSDANWGIYMAQSGASRALNDGTAPAGLDGRTEHAIRFRVANSTGQPGFIWENSDNTALMQLQPNTGNLYIIGRYLSSLNMTTGRPNLGFDTSKSLLGNLHITNGAGPGTDNGRQAGITFQGGSATEAQAGIYVLNNNSYGTSMGFAVTESYATGPQLFMTATNNGIVNFPRANPTVQGNGIWHAGNFTPSSYLPLSGGIMTGSIINNVDGGVVMESNVSEANNWLWKENAKAWGIFWLNKGSQGNMTLGTYTTIGAETLYMGGNTGIAMPSGWTGYAAGSYVAAMISNYDGYIYSHSTVYARTSVNVGGTTYMTSDMVYTRAATSGSGVQWHDQIWLGRYDKIQTAAQYPSYLPGIAYGIHVTQSSDSCFFGLISRGNAGNDYNTVIAWADDAPEDILQFRFNNNVVGTITPSGALTMSSDITAFSDIRVKENIKPIDNALDIVGKLKGVYYNRKDLEYDKSRKIGFIAQDVIDVLPEIVTYDNQIDRYGVNYGNTVAVLVEAIKEQQKQIEELKSQIKKQ